MDKYDEHKRLYGDYVDNVQYN